MRPSDLHALRRDLAQDYARRLPTAELRELFYQTLGHRLAELPGDVSRKKFRATCVDVFLALVPESQRLEHKKSCVDHRVTPLGITREQLALIGRFARRAPDEVRDKFFASVGRELRCTTRKLEPEEFRQLVADCFLKYAPHVVLEIA
jgi:hypothetical protein